MSLSHHVVDNGGILPTRCHIVAKAKTHDAGRAYRVLSEAKSLLLHFDTPYNDRIFEIVALYGTLIEVSDVKTPSVDHLKCFADFRIDYQATEY